MALTPVQEGQIIDILQYYSETLDLGQAATDILAALGFGDVRVIDLPTASPLDGSEVMYVAQLAADVKVTISQFATYINDNYIDPILDAALAALQAQVDAALSDIQAQVDAFLLDAQGQVDGMQDQVDAAIASMQATVNQSINEPKQYFMGQF